jgi:hypothetical protein
MFCYAGVSLPVIGIGLVAVEETPDIANEAFAAVITAFALLAIFVDLRKSPQVIWHACVATSLRHRKL